MAAMASNNVFVDNRAEKNTGDGFRIFDSDDNVLVENKAKSNDGHGYALIPGSTGNQLFDNDSEKNGLDGYNIASSPDTTLIDNTAKENGGVGFADDAPTSNTYIANNCTGNVGGGSTPTGLCTPQGQMLLLMMMNKRL